MARRPSLCHDDRPYDPDPGSGGSGGVHFFSFSERARAGFRCGYRVRTAGSYRGRGAGTYRLGGEAFVDISGEVLVLDGRRSEGVARATTEAQWLAALS